MHHWGGVNLAHMVWQIVTDQGHARAQSLLGVMYYDSKGVPQDRVEAVKWYRMAAEQGVANAQTTLGYMYRYGLGVPQGQNGGNLPFLRFGHMTSGGLIRHDFVINCSDN